MESPLVKKSKVSWAEKLSKFKKNYISKSHDENEIIIEKYKDQWEGS